MAILKHIELPSQPLNGNVCYKVHYGHYKHVVIGMTTMTVRDLRPNHSRRFIMIHAGGFVINFLLHVIYPNWRRHGMYKCTTCEISHKSSTRSAMINHIIYIKWRLHRIFNNLFPNKRCLLVREGAKNILREELPGAANGIRVNLHWSW